MALLVLQFINLKYKYTTILAFDRVLGGTRVHLAGQILTSKAVIA